MKLVLVPSVMRRRRHAAWVIVVAFAIGVGLITMHAGLSCIEHAESTEHGHSVVTVPVSSGALHTPVCVDCMAHTSTTMMCAVMLLAVAGAVGVRVLRRLLTQRSVTLVLFAPVWCWARAATRQLARAPDLHALQVLRC